MTEARVLARRFRQRITAEFLRCVYRDRMGASAPTAILAGTGRSGTTWIAELIDSQIPCRIMFEPFHPGKVPEYRKFGYFQYMAPDDEAPELHDFCTRLLAGQLRGPWIDGHLAHFAPRLRLIKDIRPTLLLRWLHRQFPTVPVVFAVRHPCAVVLSRMRLDWATDADIAQFLCQPRLVQDHLEPFLPLIERAQHPEEKHAVVWCISNLVPLRQFTGGGWTLLFYELLRHQPGTEIPRLFQALGFDFSDDVFAALQRPSRTTRGSSPPRSGPPGYERQLSPAQRTRIYDVVAAFGLDHLYGCGPSPTRPDPHVT